MSTSQSRFAILAAAGSSSRMGFDKTLADLRGHPVIWHTIKAFSEVPGMEEIVVVAAEEKVGAVYEIARAFPLCHMVARGGESRIDSVIRGLEALGQESGMVAIHDGARPLITPVAILNAFECAEKFGASACGEPLSDTLHQVDDVGRIEKNIARENLWRMQTPQVFPPSKLLEALRQTKELKKTPTDDAGAFLIAGRAVHISPNLQPNFKITYPTDLMLADAVLAHRHQ